MLDGPLALPTRRRLIAYRAALAVAALYFVVGGVLVLWFPSDGLDLYVSYVGGTCVMNHESPYERAAYLRAWDSLHAPQSLAESRSLGFAYPPSWIPACMALSLMPWGVAVAFWKLLNVALLTGAVLTTFRLQWDGALDTCDRYAVWCFALTLSPTLTVLIKPQFASAFVLFLVLRAEIGTLAVAAASTAILTGLGLEVSHSNVGKYVTALHSYTTINPPDSHIAVGIASLLAHFTNLGVLGVTVAGAAVGVALVLGLARLRNPDGDHIPISEVLPVIL